MSATETETATNGAATNGNGHAAKVPLTKSSTTASAPPKTGDPGTRHNLTPEETEKFQQAWVHLLRLCGSKHANVTDTTNVPDRFGAHQQFLKNKDPANFRFRMWQGILADHPDVTALRFLRARKWDVEKSMGMLLQALDWRDQRRVDETIVKDGEDVALKDVLTKDDVGFMMQYRSGKAFVRGHDMAGRPIYCIRVKLHDPKAQSGDAMEAFTLHNVESIRTMLKDPLDKVCLLFDMTGFGLKNMDFHVVRFLVQVFEARYPESLGVVLIHNAPFVFSGIWSIIKGWLDPVIASKINFTRNSKDLLKFIEKDQLQKRYGGEDTWEYKYPEPSKGDRDNLGLTDEKKAKIEADREELMKEFELATEEWVATDPQSEEAQVLIAKRTEISDKLIENYWKLDPYIRAKTYYHRVGVLSDDGKVNFQGAKE